MLPSKKTIIFDIPGILSKIGIEEKQKTAELGCGNFGFFVFPLAEKVGREGKVYAVDILKPTLEEINKVSKTNGLKQIETIWSNLEIFNGTKIPSTSLDRALLINVLHESEKKVEIIREAVRLIKHGGRLLIIEWSENDAPIGPAPERRVKLQSLKDALPRLGLSLKEEFIAGPYHYGLVLNKL
jgi:ubiquinone/menaquinone biosynthesis C-methylase UbiE